jgi:hypothetical protein
MPPDQLDTGARLAVHEAVCAERYKNLSDSLSDIKNLIKWLVGSVLTGLVTALAFMIYHYVLQAK